MYNEEEEMPGNIYPEIEKQEAARKEREGTDTAGSFRDIWNRPNPDVVSQKRAHDKQDRH